MNDSEDLDLYGILGLTPSANNSEIRKAYHRLAKEYHPDKNSSQGEKVRKIYHDIKKFKEISLAYEILNDPEKREIYDQQGMSGLREGGGGGAEFGGFPGGLFSGLFGGGGSPFGFEGMRPQGRRRQKGEDLIHPLKVGLVDLYNGKTSRLQITKSVICAKCQGQGGKPGAMQACRGCRGQGVKIVHRQIGPGMVQQMQSMCSDCHGTGEMINERDRCKTCVGKKVTQEVKVLEVHIDKGMRDGQKITMRGEGDQTPGLQPSDVIIVLQQKEHDTFQRTGNDLVMSHKVSMVESLCGFELTFKHLDGRDLVVRNTPGMVIEPGAMRCIAGEGMPLHRNPFEKGNLYIKFDVVFPDKNFIDPTKLQALEALLPPRPVFAMPVGEHVEEVDMMDFDQAAEGAASAQRSEAYHEDGDEENPRMGGMPCAQQ